MHDWAGVRDALGQADTNTSVCVLICQPEGDEHLSYNLSVSGEAYIPSGASAKVAPAAGLNDCASQVELDAGGSSRFFRGEYGSALRLEALVMRNGYTVRKTVV